MGILKLFIVTVFFRQAAFSKTIPPGVYQTFQPVSVFAGVALRVFEGQQCAVVFLCRTPSFLQSFETPVVGMRPSSSEKGCYLLLEEGRKSDGVLRKAKSMTVKYGQRVEFAMTELLPCIRGGNVSIVVGPRTLRMKKISSDPHYVLEKPFQQPSPGVYTNDGLIDKSSLSGVTLTIGEAGWSVKFSLANEKILRSSGEVFEPDPTKRCFWFEKKLCRRRLFPGDRTIVADSWVKILKLRDVGICQDSESKT
ncbi:hypothetical protein FOZ61_009399 [Perkinsus olseni]|uniref:Uncharacterized protein n=1 Tax=Perkinsus olseni TaxID=32597 RepID=A0A7J6L2B9_PEROL|nr:hypothetical protein FOZ61_009399 [Perkinsus olseni]KAF4654889.1 hypothetical protein FOL46_008482 [Perkinsus olseni]